MEGAEKFGNVERHVIALVDKPQEFGFDFFHVIRPSVRASSRGWKEE
jgi:hypothetical protein